MDLKIHTVGIKGSGRVKPGEKPGVQFYGVLEIDGVLLDHVQNIRVSSSGDQFTSVLVRLIPSTIEHVNHTDESWSQLTAMLQAQANGTQWLLAMQPEKEDEMPGKDETRWTPVEGDHGDDVSYGRIALDPETQPTDEVRTEEELAATEEANEEAAADSEYDATDGAIEAAAELGVDLSTVTGTGLGGRITKADVEAAAQG